MRTTRTDDMYRFYADSVGTANNGVSKLKLELTALLPNNSWGSENVLSLKNA